MPPFLDIKGSRFGELTAVSPLREQGEIVRWLCRCSCGNEVILSLKSLRKGTHTSCGCKPKNSRKCILIDLVGHTFSDLKVVSRAGSTKGGGSTWLCQCSCGREVICSSGNLRSGNSKRCFSCSINLRKRSRRPKKTPRLGYPPRLGRRSKIDAAFNYVRGSYIQSAEDRNLSFELSDDDIRTITSSDCFYCGSSPSRVRKSRGGSVYIYNGIDRKDNSRGYSLDNCLPCCWTCNRAKGPSKYDSFILWLESLVEFRIQNPEPKKNTLRNYPNA